MKPELLECLVRYCVREALTQLNEGDPDIKGAAAPPADGQGTGDQPEIPNEKPEVPEEPESPETPPPSAELKGVVLVNPRDKAKLQKVPLTGSDDVKLGKDLQRLGSTLAGSGVKIASSTLRMVKDAVKNPNTVTYLYLGKFDPQSSEIFLMADKSLQVAKDASIPPAELSGVSPTVVPTGGMPQTAQPAQPIGINEDFKQLVKKMVSEILYKK